MKKLLFVSNEASMTGAPLFLVKFIQYLSTERPKIKIAVFFAKNGELVENLAQQGFEVFVSDKRGNINSKLPAVLNRFIHYIRYLKVLFVYRPNLVYSNTIVNFGEVILAGLARIPVLLHMHEGRNFSSQYRYRLMISCFFASRIVVGSQYVNSVLNSLTGRLGVVVYNGINSPTKVSSDKKMRNDPFKIGVLGTIDSNKGQLVAIEAMSILREKGLSVKLEIAGKVADEEYYANLQNFVDMHSLCKSVDFVGVVPDVYSFLNSIDLLVVPSFDEAFPTVILEAFSSGTFVVASDVGGIPEMIQNKVNGLLFKASDSRMLADILEKTIDDNGGCGRSSLSALKIIPEKFDIRVTNNALSSYIDELLLNCN